MAEEFELYTPEDGSKALMVYRGEAGPPRYINLRERETVENGHEGTVWTGFEDEGRLKCCVEPSKALSPEKTVEEEPGEEYEGDKNPVEQEFEAGNSASMLFLAGLIVGMATIYTILFVLGPYAAT